MFQDIEAALAGEVEKALAAKFQVQQTVGLEQPKQSSFGELAIPVAFQLARQLRKAPRQIAEELVSALPAIPGVAALEIAGNGYINVRLDRGLYAASLSGSAPTQNADQGKVIVEHTNINPNKAAHIGHLRNAILGDTFVRMLRQAGRTVEVQNYIDNTGVQVADVVAGFYFLEKKSPEQMSKPWSMIRVFGLIISAGICMRGRRRITKRIPIRSRGGRRPCTRLKRVWEIWRTWAMSLRTRSFGCTSRQWVALMFVINYFREKVRSYTYNFGLQHSNC